MEEKCVKCGKSVAHTEDYCYFKINKKYYQFCQDCLEKYITKGDAEVWLVSDIIPSS